MYKAAEFALKQAFAIYPYSPEAVYRYVNLLVQFGKFDDALLVAQTCEKMDPANSQVSALVANLQKMSKK